MLIWVCSHFSAPKYAERNIGKGEGAHLSEKNDVKSECKKFGKNSRQMAPVLMICDEYNCRTRISGLAHRRNSQKVYLGWQRPVQEAV